MQRLSKGATKPLQLVVFGSGLGSTLEWLLAHPQPAFQIWCVVADRECGCLDIAKAHGLATVYLPFTPFLKERGIKNTRSAENRSLYDQALIERIEAQARLNHRCVDYILLAGYMRIISPLLLNHYPHRILNIHPADLLELDEDSDSAKEER